MAKLELLSVAVVAIIIAISAQQASALKCWVCNSKMPHCGESIKDVKNMNEIEKLTLIDCHGERCLKAVTNPSLVNPTVLRLCVNTTAYANSFCKAPNHKFCESCNSDGCNGAAQYGPIALFIALPVAIAKFFLL